MAQFMVDEKSKAKINKYGATIKNLESLQKSLYYFHDSKYASIYDKMRDSVIKRFEYTFDTFWKFIREYLEEKHGIKFATISPKSVWREALNARLIAQEEFDQLINMVDDRNLTSHTYNELLAQEISQRVANYYTLIQSILQRIKLPPLVI